MSLPERQIVEPAEVALLVERYVDDALEKAAKYENSAPLDNSGVWDLHRLAAEIYAGGFGAGSQVQEIYERGQRHRKADAESSEVAL